MSQLSHTSDPYKLVDERNDVLSSLLEIPLGKDEDIGRPEQDNEERLAELLDDCAFPSPLPCGTNRMSKLVPLTKHGDQVYHKQTDKSI